MKTLYSLALVALLPFGALAEVAQAASQSSEETTVPAAEAFGPRAAAEVVMADQLYLKRPVVVFADSPNDPAFQRQMREIAEQPGDLAVRDVVVIVDSDRRSGSLLRQRLRPRGFMVVIIEKDGEIKQRRPAPRSVREIGDMIDSFPLRRQELLERLPAGR